MHIIVYIYYFLSESALIHMLLVQQFTYVNTYCAMMMAKRNWLDKDDSQGNICCNFKLRGLVSRLIIECESKVV